MIYIDPEEDIIKILDIDHNQVKHLDLRRKLDAFVEYADRGSSNEPIYPLMIMERIEEAECELDEDVLAVLKEIKELCDQHDCSFWRIINGPF